MGLSEGDLDADLENEYLPEGEMPLVGLASEDGILRIARELTKEEKRYQAEKNGEVYEEEEEIPAIQPVFQVVDGAMFPHAYEPVARFTKNSVTFNSTCIAKFNRVRALSGTPEKDGEVIIDRVKHVEMLFNPIERMIAVRPCDADHPNAMPWCFDDGSSRGSGATALCSILFSIMNRDKDYSFRVPATLKCSGDDRVLFFDLDNFIGSPRKAVQEAPEEEEEIELPVPEANSSLFFSTDDEPQPLEDTEALQRKRDALAELEKHTFGKPAFDHDSDVRLPEGEEWDLMAEARVLDIRKLDDVVHIQLLVNTIENKLVVRPCAEGTKDSIRWCIAKDDTRKTREITCTDFTEKLYKLLSWDDVLRYRLQGTRITYQSEQICIFDLSAHEAWSPTTVVNGKRKAGKRILTEEWADSFGTPVEEHDAFINIDLSKGYLNANALPPASEEVEKEEQLSIEEVNV